MKRRRQIQYAFTFWVLVVAEAVSSNRETKYSRQKRERPIDRHKNQPNGLDHESWNTNELDEVLFQETPLPSLSPSFSPFPSSLPSSSSAPTGSPSKSASPSSSPSISMVLFQETSFSPFLNSLPSSSGAPTRSPSQSVSPSFRPSISMIPTESPSRSGIPTYSPSSDCSMDINGFYGAKSNETVDLEYQYQIEFTAGADLVGALLPALKAHISESVLPVLFPFVCDTRRERPLDRHRHRMVQIMGLSLLPEAVMLEGVACPFALENNETSDCEVVSGGVTLFSDGLERNEEVPVRLSILNTIRGHMTSGDYNDVHKDIVKVTFVETAATSLSQTPQTTNSGGNGGALEWYWLLLIAGSAFLIISYLFLMWQRRPKVDNEKEGRDYKDLIESQNCQDCPGSSPNDGVSVRTS